MDTPSHLYRQLMLVTARVDKYRKTYILTGVIEKKDLDRRIKTILALCQKVIDLSSNMDGEDYIKADDELWKTILALDEEAKQGEISVTPGRLVRFPVKTGYARYIISRVGKKNCKLVYLPYVDGFQSNAVVDGEVYTGEIEGVLGWEDQVSELFKRTAQAKLPVVKAEI